jgi:hypothetical protein
MIKDIKIIRESESGFWACSPSTAVCGNQTLEKVVSRIEQGLKTQSDQPHDFYIWESEGKLWSNDNKLVEECDRWHLSRYEVCEPPKDSKYQAVVILYYQPAVVMAIAA